jgi:hypothetical protein
MSWAYYSDPDRTMDTRQATFETPGPERLWPFEGYDQLILPGFDAWKPVQRDKSRGSGRTSKHKVQL